MPVADEGVAVRVAIPLREQLARQVTRAIVRHEAPAIRLEAGARLGVVENQLAVRRVHRIFIGALVGASDDDGLSTRRWNRVQVVVGAPRVLASRVLRGIGELPSVGRPRVALAPAEGARRHVVRRAGGEIELPVAVGADDEEMRARPIVPCVPVAVHQLVGDVRLHRIRIDRLLAGDVARVIRARRKDSRRESDSVPVGRPDRPRRTAREPCELLARAADLVGDPELAAGNERDALAIGRPARFGRARRQVGPCGGDAAARGRLVGERGAAVRCQARRPHGVEHRGSIRRDLRIGDGLHRLEALDGNRRLRRLVLRGERRGQRGEQNQMTDYSGHSSVLSMDTLATFTGRRDALPSYD